MGVHTGALAEGSAGGGAGRDRAVHVADRAAAGQLLADVLAPGDVVLVKASRSYGLELLAADLLAGNPPTGDLTGSTGKGTA
jgi:UDP-N-acetylmuramoyl-tripeptide--D-alanyl-D-alanine ligase